MANLDLSDQEILKNIKLVQDGSPEHRWVAFGYVPKTNNKIKLYDHGSGDLKELREELGDSTIRYAYMRFTINNMSKFLYVAWCGDGVAGPIKGSFSGHAIQFANILKPIHHQLNARNEDDIDEAAITNAITKAGGASYDSGKKYQLNMNSMREKAVTSNAEVKQVINKQDYNKTQESSEYWKSNQAVKEEAKPQRTDYKMTQERDQYWRDNQQQQTVQSKPAATSTSAPSRTVANKFQQATTKPAEPTPVAKPTPTRSVANKFPVSNASTTTAPPPPRATKPVQTYQEPEQTYEEPQQTYEDQYQEQSYDDQQQYQEQSYDDQQYQEQSYEEPQQSYEEPQQTYEEPQQSYEEQYQEQSYEEQYQEQSYDDQPGQQQDQGHYVQAVYDYNAENEGDLSFKEGEYILVLDQSDPDGWWQGQANGATGFFPSTFVKPCDQ